MKFALAALFSSFVAAAAAGAAAPPRLVLPLDVEAVGRFVYVADGGRHQVLRYDRRTRRLVVLAGTGVAGSSGDGGPARRARLDEVAGLAVDAHGPVYFADVAAGRVRRIAAGRITTVARVPAAVSLSLHPDGSRLAIASIEGGVHVLELASGRVERVASANQPHGLAYLPDGDLLVAELDALRRLDPATGAFATVRRSETLKAEPAPRGVVYTVVGSPWGGVVDRAAPDGRAARFAGTGRLSPHRERQGRLRAGILPSDVEALPDGSVLIAQTKPVPAIRLVARGSATLTTLLR